MARFNASAKAVQMNYKSAEGSFIQQYPYTKTAAVVVTDGDSPVYLDAYLETLRTDLTHPTITTTPVTSTDAPEHGGTFTAIDTISIDNGHVTGYNTKTVTLPKYVQADATTLGLTKLYSEAGTAVDGAMTQAATKTFVEQKVSDLVNSAPEALNTLGELATAMTTNKDAIEALQEVAGGKVAQTEFDAHKNDSDIHITADEREQWNKAEENVNADWNAASGDAMILNKPTLGDLAAKDIVAETDLAEGVQTKLAHAESAYEHSNATHARVDATAVSFSAALKEGTKLGTITINGTSTDLYCETDTDTTYSAGTGLEMEGTTINHSNSITAGSTTSNQAFVGFGGKFNVPNITYDAQGHITEVTNTQISIPSDPTVAYTIEAPASQANGAVTIDLKADDTVDTQVAVKGAGSVAVTTDTEGAIIVTGTNTTYTAADGIKLDGTVFKHTNSISAGTASGSTGTLAYSGKLNIPSITYDAQGHITAVDTTECTLPAQYVHPSITAAQNTSTAAPAHEETFTAVDSVTVDGNGHVTAVNTKTVTLPAEKVEVAVSASEPAELAVGGIWYKLD